MRLNEDIASLIDHLTEQRDRYSEDLDWIVRVIVDGDLSLSAEALLVLVLEGNDLRYRPSDEGDLGRCQRTVDSAPEHRRAVAQAIVRTWRPAVLANYRERVEMYKRELAGRATSAWPSNEDGPRDGPRWAEWLREATATIAKLESEWEAIDAADPPQALVVAPEAAVEAVVPAEITDMAKMRAALEAAESFIESACESLATRIREDGMIRGSMSDEMELVEHENVLAAIRAALGKAAS